MSLSIESHVTVFVRTYLVAVRALGCVRASMSHQVLPLASSV